MDEHAPDYLSRAVAGLLASPTPDQLALLKVTSDSFLKNGQWPNLDWVDWTLREQGVDAISVLESFPSWSYSSMGVYSAVWVSRRGAPDPEDHVAATVVGLSHVESAGKLLAAITVILNHCGAAFLHAPRFPTRYEQLAVGSDALDEALAVSRFGSAKIRERYLRMFPFVMDHEPLGGPPLKWPFEWFLGRAFRSWQNIEDVRGYLEWIGGLILAPPNDPAPLHLSTLSLPEAIDYLDVVWHARFRRHLFSLPGATKTVKIALEVATSDEFDSAVTALADLIGRMSAGESGSRRDHSSTTTAPAGSIDTLVRVLDEALGANSLRALRAAQTLRIINRLRAGRQHRQDGREQNPYAALGITYPPQNWSDAWFMVQMQAIQALNAIREEIQINDEPEQS